MLESKQNFIKLFNSFPVSTFFSGILGICVTQWQIIIILFKKCFTKFDFQIWYKALWILCIIFNKFSNQILWRNLMFFNFNTLTFNVSTELNDNLIWFQVWILFYFLSTKIITVKSICIIFLICFKTRSIFAFDNGVWINNFFINRFLKTAINGYKL